MTSILSKATIDSVANPLHKYRWELALFIGIPLVVDVISLAVWEFFHYVLEGLPSGYMFAHFAVAGVVKMVVLGIFWWRVRALGRPYFSLLALYAFFVAIPSLQLLSFWYYWCSIESPNRAFSDSTLGYGITPDEYARLFARDWYCSSNDIIVTLLIHSWTIAKFALLIWFARLASIINLRHAVMFICLSMALSAVPFIPTFFGSIAITSLRISNYGFWVPKSFEQLWPLSALVASVAQFVLCCIAVRVLGGFNQNKGVFLKYFTATVVLLSLAALVRLFHNWSIWINRLDYSFGDSASAAFYYVRFPETFILSYALAFAITLVVWRLFPHGDAGDSDSTPMDPSPAQTSHDSVGAAGEETTSRRV